MRRCSILAGAGLIGLFAAGTAVAGDFDFLAGQWVAIGYGPNRAEPILFKKVPFGWDAWIPWIGQTAITPSGGHKGSHIKIQGGPQDIRCYYYVTETGPREMSWSLRDGHPDCPDTTEWKRSYNP